MNIEDAPLWKEKTYTFDRPQDAEGHAELEDTRAADQGKEA